MTIENIIFDVAEALRYPVLILAMVALVVVLLEVGRLFVESRRRRRRGMPRLERALDIAREALTAGDTEKAARTVRGLGYNRPMSEVLGAIVEQGGYPDADDRISKRMAEYDYRSMKRLERTRILVRAGPALGLMGTLIPLSPALAALADGDVSGLTRDLRVAFSVTVAGLLIGMIAFAVSLVRDRFYAQDYSDVEYARASLAGKVPPAAATSKPDAAKPAEDVSAGAAKTAVVAPAAPAATPSEPPPQPSVTPSPASAGVQQAQQQPPAPPAQPPAPPYRPPSPGSTPGGSSFGGPPDSPSTREGTETRNEP